MPNTFILICLSDLFTFTEITSKLQNSALNVTPGKKTEEKDDHSAFMNVKDLATKG